MNKSKGTKKDKREGQGKSVKITPGDEKTDNPVISGSEGIGTERKDGLLYGSLIKDSESVRETPDIRSESVGESKRITGGLGNNPLDRIDPSGLQGLITGSKTQIKIDQELLYTKAVKLTYEDLEFIKDMAISVKEEGNISAGIRACIKVARKQVGDKIKELAAQRKASEAFEI